MCFLVLVLFVSFASLVTAEAISKKRNSSDGRGSLTDKAMSSGFDFGVHGASQAKGQKVS